MSAKLSLWGNNCWIENDTIWFCSRKVCALFCMDINVGNCKLVSFIPENDKNQSERYLYCIKYKDIVFCLPYLGKCIWYYDLKALTWGKIEINNENYLMFFPQSYKEDESRIWLLEDETGRLFEVDVVKKELRKEYCIPREGEAYVGAYVRIGSELYCVSGKKIYCINILSSDIKIYEVPEVKKELYTICFDGNNFWLGGCCKEIYIWNQKYGIIKTITEFPEQFGFYHFKEDEIPYLDCKSRINEEYTFFSTSLPLGNYIWYITCRSNGIVYIDRKEYKVFYLEIEDEQETQESIKNNFLGYKFQFEYIRKNRYIGVYSIKNGQMFEIDTLDLCVQKREFQLDDQTILSSAKDFGNINGKYIFKENENVDKILFSAVLKNKEEKEKEKFQNIGKKIYCELN